MKSKATDDLLKAFRGGIEEIEVAEAQGVQRARFTGSGRTFVDLLAALEDKQKGAVIIELCGRLIVAEGELNELKLERLA